jgi:hypothetical protein
MSIIPKLATSLNRRDEVPNQELAAGIVKTKDAAAGRALPHLRQNLRMPKLRHHKSRGLHGRKTLPEL